LWDSDNSSHQNGKTSEEDLKSIYEYIANILQEPVIAGKQISRIMDAIEQLDEFPLRYHMYEKEPWKSKGLRVLSINKYLAFYIPDETRKIQ
jgi:toxin ParE1/3/4